MSAVLLAQGALMRGFNPPDTVPIISFSPRARRRAARSSARAYLLQNVVRNRCEWDRCRHG
jgi:hypothetical protein